MGFFLDQDLSKRSFAQAVFSPYFVDKSELLARLFPLIGTNRGYVCVTRPRRFGKTMAAEMVSCFFGAKDSRAIFGSLKIAAHPDFDKHLNQHHVFHMGMNWQSADRTFDGYLEKIVMRLRSDIEEAYPELQFSADLEIVDLLSKVHQVYGHRFVFVLDEWDFVFQACWATETDRQAYLGFLRTLLKDQPFVELAYLTGVLPIRKYSSTSDLNNFTEHTFIEDVIFADDFGFTHSEVVQLFEEYVETSDEPTLAIEDLEYWYDGYWGPTGTRLYCPRSITQALNLGVLGNYWGNSGSVDEVLEMVQADVEGVREAMAELVEDIPVEADIDSFSVVPGEYRDISELLSAMVIFGLLTYRDWAVSIPNHEVKQKFIRALRKDRRYASFRERLELSENLKNAMSMCDSVRVAEIVQKVHDEKSTVYTYNSESDLAHTLDCALIGLEDRYLIRREERSGVGFADFVITPLGASGADSFILELKVDDTPDNALAQIRSRRYIQRIDSNPLLQGRIIGVGITYWKRDPAKGHTCAIEVLRDRRW